MPGIEARVLGLVSSRGMPRVSEERSQALLTQHIDVVFRTQDAIVRNNRLVLSLNTRKLGGLFGIRVRLRNSYPSIRQRLGYGACALDFWSFRNCSSKSAPRLLSFFADPISRLLSLIRGVNWFGSIRDIQDLLHCSHVRFEIIQCLQYHSHNLGILFRGGR